MKNTLVVVTDLGGFKAFRLDNGVAHTTPRLELLEEFSNAEAHDRLVEKVSDLSGRFPRGTGAASGAGAMSDGERHNIELERCFLAASREINHQLLDELESGSRAKVAKLVAADLTKTDKSELLRHFAG